MAINIGIEKSAGLNLTLWPPEQGTFEPLAVVFRNRRRGTRERVRRLGKVDTAIDSTIDRAQPASLALRAQGPD
jgi:hypothetical protein